ncbi:hypothetical protein RM844_17255 [Streptomyces sp. DSM 44915]|uniref:Uncharacterized protein n=1 Tax=Streptomyces chisholmiae TaxID=3075540 RepID=A0ABU2JSR5_9ACTN|nr:hypothetical protein [Streptomyces sp. DSM 44915]MDT0268031.1 hypothetical protein [Streptomyces sp. DSM 44915]
MTDTSTRAAVAAGMAAGYFLGRTRKAKLALVIASYAMGRRLRPHPGELVGDGLRRLTGGGPFDGLAGRVRGELLAGGQTVLRAAVHRGYDTVADSLAARSKALLESRLLPGGGDDGDGGNGARTSEPATGSAASGDRKRRSDQADPAENESTADAAAAEDDPAADPDDAAAEERPATRRGGGHARRRPGEPLTPRERAPRRPARAMASGRARAAHSGGDR